jgi:SAM-dependent methyltransferase
MKCYENRWQFIETFVMKKDVLDIGPAELMGTKNRFKFYDSIHMHLTQVANRLSGLEKNAEQIGPLRELGYDIRQGDAEGFDLGERFDVVMAGELIEHLSNPGLFLDCAKRHLRPDGTLLLTTPNRFGLPEIVSAFVHNRLPSYSKAIAKHVACYDEILLKDLLRRHGFGDFTVAYYVWVGKPHGNRTLRTMNMLLRRFRPSFCPGLMIAARPLG